MAITRFRPGTLPDPWVGVGRQWWDGDTLNVSGGPPGRIIRLYGIDAPEWGQAGAGAAWRFLRDSTLRGPVHVTPVALDRFARVVAKLATYEIPDIALALLLRGLVWWEYRWAPDEAGYRAALLKAREQALGLWHTKPYAFAPWVFRARKRH